MKKPDILKYEWKEYENADINGLIIKLPWSFFRPRGTYVQYYQSFVIVVVVCVVVVVIISFRYEKKGIIV